MNEREYKDNSGWAAFGKFVGVVGAIAAVGGAGYGVFYWGQTVGREEGKNNIIQELSAADRYIPDGACFRYSDDGTQRDYYGTFQVNAGENQRVYTLRDKCVPFSASTVMDAGNKAATIDVVVDNFKVTRDSRGFLEYSKFTSEWNPVGLQ